MFDCWSLVPDRLCRLDLLLHVLHRPHGGAVIERSVRHHCYGAKLFSSFWDLLDQVEINQIYLSLNFILDTEAPLPV